MKKNKKGFTLAEVLITLSILGIVAAISIPSIINNYQKQATVSRLKMAYSMLDRLTQQSYIENGYPPIDGAMSETRFNTYFGKYLNISKECGKQTGIPKDTGCFKIDKTKNVDAIYTLDGIYSNSSGYQSTYYYKVLLKNGMSLGVWYLNIINNPGYIFLVDIDGPNRGDSKVGQDVFQFVYYSPQLPGTKYCQNVTLFPGMFTTYDADSSCNIPRANFLDYCKENGTNQGQRWNGMGCSGLIIKDGWKISSDYPWSYAHKK